MAASAPQTPAGDDRNLVTVDENYLAPTFEDRLQMFWEKHSRTIVALVLIVVAALVVRWAFGVFAEQREQAVRADYAAAGTSEQLREFLVANPQAPLAGVAALRLADEAYAAGKYVEAKADYSTAARLLRGNPLESRARLGAAISPLMAGDLTSAQNAMEEISNDTTVVATVRAEAAYHLAVLARDAGKPEEVARWTSLVLSVAPESIWSQRALQLRSTQPSASVAVTSGAGAVVDESAAGEPAGVSFPAAK